MTKNQLNSNECNPYFLTYINKAGDLNLLDGLKENGNITLNFFKSLVEDKYDFSYAEGKWSIKELLQHIIDTERVFTYRALSFSRKDAVALPGYNENEYAAASEANKRSKQSLLNEYKALRLATIALYESFSEEMLLQIGNASNSDLSVRAIGFILIGHENHHCQIIRERYL